MCICHCIFYTNIKHNHVYSQIHFAKVTSDFNDEQSLLTMEVDLVKPTTIISLVMNALLQPILISLNVFWLLVEIRLVTCVHHCILYFHLAHFKPLFHFMSVYSVIQYNLVYLIFIL